VRLEGVDQLCNLFRVLGHIRCLVAVRHGRGGSKGA
jgi:hypothetical protein